MLLEARNYFKRKFKDIIIVEEWETKCVGGRPYYVAETFIDNTKFLIASKYNEKFNVKDIDSYFKHWKFITYRDKVYYLVVPYRYEHKFDIEHLKIPLSDIFKKYIEHSCIDDYVLAFLIYVTALKTKCFLHINASTGFGKTGLGYLLNYLCLEKIYCGHVRTYAKFRTTLYNKLSILDEIHRLSGEELNNIVRGLLKACDFSDVYHYDVYSSTEVIDISELSIILLSNDISYVDFEEKIPEDLKRRLLFIQLQGTLSALKGKLSEDDYEKLFNFVNSYLLMPCEDLIMVKTKDARTFQNAYNLLNTIYNFCIKTGNEWYFERLCDKIVRANDVEIDVLYGGDRECQGEHVD